MNLIGGISYNERCTAYTVSSGKRCARRATAGKYCKQHAAMPSGRLSPKRKSPKKSGKRQAMGNENMISFAEPPKRGKVEKIIDAVLDIPKAIVEPIAEALDPRSRRGRVAAVVDAVLDIPKAVVKPVAEAVGSGENNFVWEK